MRAALFVASTAVLLVSAGCGQAGIPTSPTALASREVSAGASKSSQRLGPAAAVNSRASKPREVTVAGRIEGTFSVTGEPPVISVHLEAIGNATDVGRFDLVSDHVVSFITLKGEGTASLTTPNGDSVEAILDGEAMPTGPGQFDIEEMLAIKPETGTGRFAGASGTLRIQRSAISPNGIQGTTSGTISGTIVLHGDRD